MSRTGQEQAGPLQAVIVTGHFELARGSWFEPHTHAEHQLAWGSRGIVSIRIADRTWVLPGGLALWIPAGTTHATGAIRETDLVGIYLPTLTSPFAWTEPTVLAVGPLARELLTYLRPRPGTTLSPELRRHAEALLVDALRPVADVQVELPMPVDGRALQIARGLVTDPGDPRTLEQWGRAVGASARTLARVWLAETGSGFAGWRTRCRIRASLPPLADGVAVSVVARGVGYESPSAFVAAFSRELGTTPGQAFAGRR